MNSIRRPSLTVPRHTAIALIASMLFGVGVAAADGQTSTSKDATLIYGVSGGAGRRTTDGTFLTSALPAGATQPPSRQTTGTFGLTAGVRFLDRIAFMAVWDQTFGGTSTSGNWGTSNVHAVGRLWITKRLWVEAGGGASELGYKPPPQTSVSVTRFWAPGVDVAAGVDVLSGPRVALVVFGRYAAATFDNLTVRSATVQVGLVGRR